jgi:hypothetical protein
LFPPKPYSGYAVNGDEFADVEASFDLGECTWEWVVGWESGVNCFDGSKDEITEVVEGERIFWAVSSKEETNADAIDNEAEGLVHVIDERDGYS